MQQHKREGARDRDRVREEEGRGNHLTENRIESPSYAGLGRAIGLEISTGFAPDQKTESLEKNNRNQVEAGQQITTTTTTTTPCCSHRETETEPRAERHWQRRRRRHGQSRSQATSRAGSEFYMQAKGLPVPLSVRPCRFRLFLDLSSSSAAAAAAASKTSCR